MSTRRVSVTVSGRVQGVSYRWYTREQAEALGVSGWVRNRADGTVQVEAEGPDDAVERLVAWLRAGPAHALVVGVDVVEVPAAGGSGFEIRR